jgi:hypothetical protein
MTYRQLFAIGIVFLGDIDGGSELPNLARDIWKAIATFGYL